VWDRFTECVGSYMAASGDTDVGGKNYAWSLKWSGHAPQGEGRGRHHAKHTAKASIEIIRRFRRTNPNRAGIMPFSTPFLYCGDNVTKFADVASVDPGKYSTVQCSAVQCSAPTDLAILHELNRIGQTHQ
jgi:hypothetical protein